MFCIVAALFCILNNRMQVFQFLQILTITCSFFLHNSHSNTYEMISHCGIDLRFPDHQCHWAVFHTPVDHVFVFIWGNICSSLFFNCIILFHCLLLSCRISLYILEINPLLDIWFAVAFSDQCIVKASYFSKDKHSKVLLDPQGPVWSGVHLALSLIWCHSPVPCSFASCPIGLLSTLYSCNVFPVSQTFAHPVPPLSKKHLHLLPLSLFTFHL